MLVLLEDVYRDTAQSCNQRSQQMFTETQSNTQMQLFPFIFSLYGNWLIKTNQRVVELQGVTFQQRMRQEGTQLEAGNCLVIFDCFVCSHF